MRRSTIPLFLVGAVLVIALLTFAGVLRTVQDGARWAFLPVARVFAGIGSGIGNRFAPTSEQSALEETVRDLEARIRSISVDYVKLKSLESENESLRQLTKFLDASGFDYVSARIIARSPDQRTAEVLIDRGAKDNLEIGMAVVVENGVFLGKITNLKEHVSTVTLVADERSRVAASVAGQSSGLIGLVEGQGNGVARLTLVPQATPMKRDDIIVTSGTEEKIPGNLAIGLVNQVDGAATDPFKTASLQPLARIGNVNLVAVLRPTALRPTP